MSSTSASFSPNNRLSTSTSCTFDQAASRFSLPSLLIGPTRRSGRHCWEREGATILLYVKRHQRKTSPPYSAPHSKYTIHANFIGLLSAITIYFFHPTRSSNFCSQSFLPLFLALPTGYLCLYHRQHDNIAVAAIDRLSFSLSLSLSVCRWRVPFPLVARSRCP